MTQGDHPRDVATPATRDHYSLPGGPNDASPSTARPATPATPAPDRDLVLPAPAIHRNQDSTILSVVNNYRLIRRIGAGAFGQVYMGEAPGGTEVAVKVITRPLDEHEAQQELKALEHVKRIRHPYLVQTQAFWILNEQLYIVMELADGSLNDRLKECRKQGLPGIPVAELLPYFQEAAEALDYLHARRVQHRDIKPANILLLGGHAKLADFGLARALHAQSSVTDATMCGTPSYMAPEVWRGTLSNHSDQWSLAATYAELRLNRRLFQADHIATLMVAILEGNCDLSPLPEAEQRVLRKALAVAPHDRYPTCRDFVQALQEALKPPPPPPPEPAERVPAPVEVPAGRQLGRLVPLLLVACLGVLGYAVYLGHGLVAGARVPLVRHRILLDPPAAVEATTGRQITVPLRIRRENHDGRVRITLLDDVPDVTLTAEAFEPGLDVAHVRVEVAPKARPGSHKVHLRLDGCDPPLEAVLPLTVLYLPPDFLPGGKVVTDGLGVGYFEQLSRDLEGDRVTFLLVPKKKRTSDPTDPPTFYILQDKVSLGMFRKFADRFPDRVASSLWRRGTDERHPVLGVTVEDAYRFASLQLQGHLPTVEQWDKAAGRYEPSRGEGPYRGSWASSPRPNVAVQRKGPAPLGSAAADVSPYGCRDMAGNGQEWTRTLLGGLGHVPIQGPSQSSRHAVRIRGCGFQLDAPLRYADLDRGVEAAWAYDEPEPETGFRVVLEP